MMKKQEIPGSGGPCLNSSVHAEPKGGPIARSSVAHDSRGDKTCGCGGDDPVGMYENGSCAMNSGLVVAEIEELVKINGVDGKSRRRWMEVGTKPWEIMESRKDDSERLQWMRRQGPPSDYLENVCKDFIA
ncbi:hypothetical protein SADUNF_Sadunf08G0092100 [Salix dunnii]|uniref:Uncharacterized protein n=1 Tax=Salix dunnii TaxID=1413687 RepID=A0A835MTT3_9ROSI|nr:hypothetical protein SADUNF_Sadunf08G0092100 [Salix dunnii]